MSERTANFHRLLLLACVAVLSWMGGAGRLPYVQSPSVTPAVVPKVDPAPFKVDLLSMAIVEDTDVRDKLTDDQKAIITSNAPGSVRAVVQAINPAGFRTVDPTPAPDLQYDAQWVRDAYAVKRESLPWIIVSNGRTGFSLPLNESPAKVLERLKAIGSP